MKVRITNPLFTPGSYGNLNVGDEVEILTVRDTERYAFPLVFRGGVLAESEVEHVREA